MRKYSPYVHSKDPQVSAAAVWKAMAPQVLTELATLQKASATPESYKTLSKLYLLQSKCPPAAMRRVLAYQLQQKQLSADPRLMHDDLALFGWRTFADWFGKEFIEISAQFIWNSALAAEKKGYKVSLEEARGDLICQFQKASKRHRPNVSFQQHLSSLGFDENSAAQHWRKVLLFRKYFHDVGGAAFVDRLAHKEMAPYAGRKLWVQTYKAPFELKSKEDLAELNYYVKMVADKTSNGLVESYLSVEEVEKRAPALVRQKWRAEIAEVSKEQVGLLAEMKQVRSWQVEHWDSLKQKFSLPSVKETQERYSALDKLAMKQRADLDRHARLALVDEHPEWVEQALQSARVQEKTWDVSLVEEPILKKEGYYYRIENLQKVEDSRIALFTESRKELSQLVGKIEGALESKDHPFVKLAKEAQRHLLQNQKDERFVQSQSGILAQQFHFLSVEEQMGTLGSGACVQEKTFSPVRFDETGIVSFFFVKPQESARVETVGALLGKKQLAYDAQNFAAKKLLKTIQEKNAIVIPLQKEG